MIASGVRRVASSCKTLDYVVEDLKTMTECVERLRVGDKAFVQVEKTGPKFLMDVAEVDYGKRMIIFQDDLERQIVTERFPCHRIQKVVEMLEA